MGVVSYGRCKAGGGQKRRGLALMGNGCMVVPGEMVPVMVAVEI